MTQQQTTLKNHLLITIILALILLGCSSTRLELLEEPSHSADSAYIKHAAYSLSYNEETEQPRWVAYKLDSTELIQNYERTNTFAEDTLVLTKTANDEDYKYSGYDRGHLAPAADMAWNEQAMQESFYYSNISPQLPAFNRGIWKVLEALTRSWAQNNRSLYITCGPVFLNEDSVIGDNQIVIPTHFFKTILIYNSTEKQSIGFLLPHGRYQGDIFDFAVPVDSIEKVTGLDLYHKLPDTIEKTLEAQIEIKLWK
ncbi:DNA/RNA non-specific endonuclease [Marinilabilia salmonicolor]|uniref:DNA/RNA non-specific endonuclease n=1 Tax=Marinilabilia salmonicolor TaxID=989 RepID=UPI00029A9902|nr:DNA/RNA non-specific endonuclease [Marinilabilia salmonicolor]